MTTRIEGVYRLAPGADIATFGTRLAAAMNPVRDRLEAEALSEATIFGLDRIDFAGEVRPAAPARHFAEALVSKWLASTSDPVSALFVTDPGTGRVLVLVFDEHGDYQDAFRSMDGVEGYSYWDDDDRPEHINAEEWSSRDHAWNRVFPETGAYPTRYLWQLHASQAEDLLTMAGMVDGNGSPLLKHAPSTESRLDRLSADIYASWLARNTTETDDLLVNLRAARANRAPLERALAPLLAPVTTELLRNGVGTPRMTEIEPDLGALCRTIHGIGDHNTWLEREGLS